MGLEFHEDPWVSFVSEENTGALMVPGNDVYDRTDGKYGK